MKLRLAREDREDIGRRLRELRSFYELEQVELADRAGLSQAVISQYEKGQTEPSLFFIKFLAETFGISGDWFLFGAGRSPHEQLQKEMRVQIAASVEAEAEEREGAFYGIPLLDVCTAAAPGKVPDERVGGWELVHISEVTGRTNLVAIELTPELAAGMEPVFRPGSRVVIDRDDKTIVSDAYFAVNTQRKKGGPRGAAITAIRKLNLTGNRLWLIR
ncbi:MAG: helix-turn-helix domain-containing protein, partial [Nitrospinota bacterium]